MKLTGIFSLILFAVSTTVHLCASYRKDQRLRNLTKPYIILSLLGFYCSTAQVVSYFIVIALFFSWLGDVFFIFPGMKCFVSGGISFMFSHLFFILGYLELFDINSVPLYFIIPIILFFITTVCIVIFKLRPHLPVNLFYPMFLYLLLNGSMNCFALFRMLSSFSLGSVLTCIGALLFFVSDSVLFFIRFKNNGKEQSHFTVMLTYSIGELLIILGLIRNFQNFLH